MVLLVTILTISCVSINPTPSVCQLLFIIFAPRRRCCLAAAPLRQGEGSGGHPVNKGYAKQAAQIAATWLSLRWDANWIQTTAAVAAACGATMSVSDLSDGRLHALLDHLQD